MTRRSQALLVGVFAVAFAIAGYLIHQWQQGAFGGGQRLDATARGELVLAARLMGLDGEAQALAQWRGNVLIINFWATWCAPCREEIPGFIKFQNQYRARGVQFVGIAIDNRDRVGPYAKDIGINYPVLVGGIETMEFSRHAGNQQGVLPFTVVIDRTGKVAATVTGVLKPDTLEKMLLPLL